MGHLDCWLACLRYLEVKPRDGQFANTKSLKSILLETRGKTRQGLARNPAVEQGTATGGQKMNPPTADSVHPEPTGSLERLHRAGGGERAAVCNKSAE